jgi:hypothetical protein
LKLNKEALGLARELGDVVLEHKIKYGIKYSKLKTQKGDKGITPLERAEDFAELSKALAENGSIIDSARASIESAKGYFELACLQSSDTARQSDHKKNLEESRIQAEKALEVASEYGYSNLEVLAHEILGEIYRKMDQGDISDQYSEKAKENRDKYNYKTLIK